MREDYIMRLIKQLADAIARMAGFNRKRDWDAALAESERAWSDLLDVPRGVVEVVDTPTLASMLREPEKMRAAAELLIAEARALTGKGDPLNAAVQSRRAIELYLEAHAIDPRETDDAAILELSRVVPAEHLDPRYRS
jgi:hypothetical protein